MMDSSLDFRALEVPAYDVVDMAHLFMTIVHDAVEESPGDDGFIRLTQGQADTLLFASRLMMEKANAVKKTWDAVHDALAKPIRMTGGAK